MLTILQNLLTSWLPLMREKYANFYTVASESFCTDDTCCNSCSPEDCIYSCEDCTGTRFSRECLLFEHRYNPLHHIKVRTPKPMPRVLLADFNSQVLRDKRFMDTSLAELGLVIQLNHRRGICPKATVQTQGFTVYHTNGAHIVNISYCTCHSHLPQNSRLGQIFRQRWLPATWKRPRTAFTFACMNTFHLLNLQSKCNLYDYYATLTRITDNGNIKDQPVSRTH
jgi:hypothetical protein